MVGMCEKNIPLVLQSLGCLEKMSFRPIYALCSKFYPRNITCMPVVKF